ncbi:MAG TPA: regulatory protein RecX [Candidatus Avipropionibacterium avicola]|uniref:Regulatory protein RecX n=1 Tax=Candidatus Avipropionibacterium avicola TaxID=2840701 RepID=A0A9D1GVY4_9ACTN|nr:regulatory protein RecX [Candidatus Avipropionibacterium avicola]
MSDPANTPAPPSSDEPDADRIASLAEAIRRIESGQADTETVQLRAEREQEQQARAIVLRRLSVQPRTRAELATTLQENEVATEVAERILDRMSEVGLIDDETFAKDWVASRQQRKHLSRRKLADELRQKGVAPALVEDALAEVADDDEYQAALDLAERKMASLSRHEVAVQRRRLAGMLERRGFGIGLIHRVLRDVLEG